MKISASVVIMSKEAILGLVEMRRACLYEFTFKCLEFEVLLGHSGRTVQKIPDREVWSLREQCRLDHDILYWLLRQS